MTRRGSNRQRCGHEDAQALVTQRGTRFARNQTKSRHTRLLFENLERRFCLSAELGWLHTAESSLGIPKIDSGGNFYVSSGTQIIKYSPAREVLWKVNLRNAFDLDLDADGNLYVSGSVLTTTLAGVSGNVVITSQGNGDVYVVKFTPAGLAVWGRVIGNSAQQLPGGMAVTPGGIVYVSGSFKGSLTLAGTDLVSAGYDDMFVAKLNTNGTIAWGRRFGSSTFEQAWGMDLDADGNAYVIGTYDAEFVLPTLSGNVTIPNADSRDGFVVKVNPTGDFVWGVGIGGSTGVKPTAVAFDPAGTIVVAGDYTGSVDFDPGPEVSRLPGGNNLFVWKLDLNGNYLWAHSLYGSGGQGGRVAIGPTGQIHLAGIFYGTMDADPLNGGYFLTTDWGDAFIVTLTSAGQFVAARNWGDGGVDGASGVTTDTAGNVYVAGHVTASDDVDFDPGPGTRIFNGGNGTDGFLLQLTAPTASVGDRLWHDLNANGLQDAGELGLAGAVVELFSTVDNVRGNADDGRVARVITDATGDYHFDQLASGNYFLVAHAPVGYTIAIANVGANEAVDNDVLSVGQSDIFPLFPGEQKTDRDTGLSGAALGFGFGLRVGAAALQSTGNRVVVDADGNSYVAGWFQGTQDFDPGPTTVNRTALGTDAYVAKYTAGGALVWVTQAGSATNDYGVDVVVNDAGEVYFAGQFTGTFYVGSGPSGQSVVAVGSSSDVFLTKLDRDGDMIWLKSIGGSSQENVAGLEWDAAGNLVLAGTFSTTVDFNPGLATGDVYSLTTTGSTDVFVLRLTAAGGFIGATKWGGTSQDDVRDLAVDAANNIYTTGAFRFTVDFDPTAAALNLTSAGGQDAYISKLNADGTLAWAVRHGNTGDDAVNDAIQVDDAGNVYTAGAFLNQVDFGGVTLTSVGLADGYVAKRNSAGTLQWVRQFGNTGNDEAHGLDLDAAGDLYVTGNFTGVARFPDAGTTFLFGATGAVSAFVQKLNPSGQHQALYPLVGGTSAQGRDVTVNDLTGRIHLTGAAGNLLDFDPRGSVYAPPSVGGLDSYLAQLIQAPAQARLALTPANVTENSGSQTVGPVTIVNGASGETFTLQAIFTTAEAFSIVNGQLVANTNLLDFETAPLVAVQVRAIGSQGTELNQLFTVQVLNANDKPVVESVPNQSAVAGATWQKTISFSDQDSGDSWSATVNYGDGGGTQPLALQPDNTFSLAHNYATTGLYTAAVVLTDTGGLSDTRQVQVNVLPPVEITGPSIAVPGEGLSFSGSILGTLPAGDYTITWNFGDGTPLLAVPLTGAWQNQTHEFAGLGKFAVTMTLTDATGGRSSMSLPIKTRDTRLESDPNDPTLRTLLVGGSDNADMIRILPAGLHRVNVYSNNRSLGLFTEISQVIVYGLGGDDFILGAARGNVSHWLHGGDGNDRLIGGNGHDVLLGGAGNDIVSGGEGRDLLVGGTDSDQLDGQNGEDLLIAAVLSMPNLKAGLQDIVNEWLSERPFLERVANLQGDAVGERANGDTLLLVAQSVLDDEDEDWLTGGDDSDWFLANSQVDHYFQDPLTDHLEDLSE